MSGGSAAASLIDPYLEKIEKWVEGSRGKLRADVAHENLMAMGYRRSERTARRGAAAKASWGAWHRRIHRPWVWVSQVCGFSTTSATVPPSGGGQPALFCAWLAWSRFRVVLPILDRTLPTVIACVDTTLRRFGGWPT